MLIGEVSHCLHLEVGRRDVLEDTLYLYAEILPEQLDLLLRVVNEVSFAIFTFLASLCLD